MRFLEFVAIVVILRLALLHLRLYLASHARYVTTFTRILAIVTVVLVVALAAMLIIPLVWRDLDVGDLYWRFVVSLTILAAVGTALIPLINALNAPKKPRRAHTAQAGTPWPTYVDGVTPLPVMPDGSPDWNAYYTGYPTVQWAAPPPGSGYPLPPPGEPAASPAPAGASAPVPSAPVPSTPVPSAPPLAPSGGYPPPPPLPPRPPLP